MVAIPPRLTGDWAGWRASGLAACCRVTQLGLIQFEHSSVLAPFVDRNTVRLKVYSIPVKERSQFFMPVQVYLYGAAHYEMPVLKELKDKNVQLRWTRFMAAVAPPPPTSGFAAAGRGALLFGRSPGTTAGPTGVVAGMLPGMAGRGGPGLSYPGAASVNASMGTANALLMHHQMLTAQLRSMQTRQEALKNVWLGLSEQERLARPSIRIEYGQLQTKIVEVQERIRYLISEQTAHTSQQQQAGLMHSRFLTNDAQALPPNKILEVRRNRPRPRRWRRPSAH